MKERQAEKAHAEYLAAKPTLDALNLKRKEERAALRAVRELAAKGNRSKKSRRKR